MYDNCIKYYLFRAVAANGRVVDIAPPAYGHWVRGPWQHRRARSYGDGARVSPQCRHGFVFWIGIIPSARSFGSAALHHSLSPRSRPSLSCRRFTHTHCTSLRNPLHSCRRPFRYRARTIYYYYCFTIYYYIVYYICIHRIVCTPVIQYCLPVVLKRDGGIKRITVYKLLFIHYSVCVVARTPSITLTHET